MTGAGVDSATGAGRGDRDGKGAGGQVALQAAAIPADSCELILVRHGETAWNHERRIQGQLDTPLSPVGLAQAEAAAARLASARVAALYTSDLERTRQTAAPIAAALRLVAIDDARLRERHFGALQGLRYPEIERDQPEQYQRIQARDLTDDLRGGETLPAFFERVAAALTAIAGRHRGESVIVVTHGGALDVAWRLATGTALDGPRDVGLYNASLNVIWHGADGWSLRHWGVIDHLLSSQDDIDPRGRASHAVTRIA